MDYLWNLPADGGPSGIDADQFFFLLRDDFLTDEPAPINSYTASSATVVAGIIDSGTLDDTSTEDSSHWVIQEEDGVIPGFQIDFTFDGITDGQQVVLTGYYVGSASHEVEVYAWDGSAWDLLGSANTGGTQDSYYLDLDDEHTIDGTVQIRLQHNDTLGDDTHYLHIDHIYVQDLRRVAEPGPGYWYVRQDSNDTSRITDRAPQVAQNTGSYEQRRWVLSDEVGDPRPLSPRAGLAMRVDNIAMSRSGVWTVAGFSASASLPQSINSTSGGGGVYNGTVFNNQGPAGLWSNGDDLVLVLRTSGGVLLTGDGTMLWVWTRGDGSPVYPMFSGVLGTSQDLLDYISVARLPGAADDAVPGNGYEEWGHRDLDVTGTIETVTAGANTTHTPDAVIDLVDVTVPTSGVLYFRFRDLDGSSSNSCWIIGIGSSGSVGLYEGDGAGSAANRAGAGAGAISNSDSLTVLCLGERIQVFVNDTQIVDYASATAWIDQTRCEVDSLGTGGAITEVVALTLDGVANAGSTNHLGYGIATDVQPGPLAEDDEATRELASWSTVTLEAIPSSGVVEYAIRYIDADNYIYLEVDSSGNWDLRSVTGGAASASLATATPGSVGGEHIVIIDDGSSLKLYEDNTLQVNQSSGAHNTATKTRVLSLGTGGQLSNLISFPGNLATSTPGAIIERMAS